MKNEDRIKVFSGGSNHDLFSEICRYLNVPEGKIMMTTFADGEIYCRIEESVRGRDTFIIQPTCSPANENLMKLLIIIDALKRASAGSITAVVPYFGYARQEKKATGREPITAKLVANLITTAGANRVVTMDMHDPALQGFFDIPVDHLSAIQILASHLLKRDLHNYVVVSPDTGGVHRARAFAKRLELPLAIMDKRRPEPNKAVIMNVIGEVSGKNVFIIDDMIDTAGTMVQVAQALLERGVKKITACCTHPVLSDPASERIMSSSITEIIATDSLYTVERKKKLPILETLSVAPLIGETIQRIFDKRSVSELFIR
ncbi:MAG: ribose-phosphate pyrophosphokinase [Candidatus Riflebacteria bacterium]|nr:ribose-phosphate pyrophosphokinase [Candidatus Riflebacteria bacterium]